MGDYYTLRLYKTPDHASLQNAMVHVAETFGGFIHWGRPGEGRQDLRLARGSEIPTVYLPYQTLEFPFCQEVGALLEMAWLELRIQDSSHWDYALYRGRAVLDTFSVCPQYWDGTATTGAVMKEWQGKPEVLAQAWDLPVERFQNYLVNWGYRSEPNTHTFEFERRGKAYPTDKYDYGDYEQFFDVLRTLGGKEPLERHTIHLPEATRP